MITKYVVIKTDGKVEYLSMEAAQTYKDTHQDCIRIDTVQEADAAITEVQREVANWRVISVLKLMGLDDDVAALIESFPEPNRTIAQMGYERGNTIDRISPIVMAIQQALNLTNQQVDDIFTSAESIPA